MSLNGSIPIILAGDFNAEPTEPVYKTITTKHGSISFQSAYANMIGNCKRKSFREPEYTSWKFRNDGEHVETLDYIFYHSPAQFINDSKIPEYLEQVAHVPKYDWSLESREERYNKRCESKEKNKVMNYRFSNLNLCNNAVLDFPTESE